MGKEGDWTADLGGSYVTYEWAGAPSSIGFKFSGSAETPLDYPETEGGLKSRLFGRTVSWNKVAGELPESYRVEFADPLAQCECRGGIIVSAWVSANNPGQLTDLLKRLPDTKLVCPRRDKPTGTYR